MNEITRVFYAEMAHRLHGHEGKCQHLHGHSYRIEVTVSGPLDSLGRVIDFSVLKDGIGGWIAKVLDHGTTLAESDPLAPLLSKDGTKLLLVPYAPSAENLANLIAEMAQQLHQDVKVTAVRVWETEHGMAQWVRP